jgi:type IV pilus assembly protein PilY1
VTTGNCPINKPGGFSCTAGLWVPDLDKPAPARYYVFAPATPIANPTAADLSNPANYARVEINRDKRHEYPNFVGRHGKDKNGDGVVSAAELEPGQCIPGALCSWEAEAQNFANWYTYYRTRLTAAIGVTAASMSRLTNESGLDRLRLGYGSINNYAGGPDPYSTTGATIVNTDIDGISSDGAIVRGVRPFTEKIDSTTLKTPSNSTLNADKDPRQEVFNWLFSLRAIGATPNREAIDSVGRYFSSKSNRGPWISPTAYDPKTPSTWSSQEAETEHISCRRNYSILVTDGEWTNQPPPQQRIIEEVNPPTPLNALTSTVPGSPHIGRPLTAPGVLEQWVPSENPQFSRNATGITGTLTDVTLHYWATDLRTDLPNSVIPPDPPPVDRLYNPAYWQHMSTYIVGYGLTASRDTAGNRQTILDSSKRETPVASRQAVEWPSVNMDQLLLTDSDAACKNVDANGNDLTKGAGCGRVDDTFRAALASRGNFLTATDIGQLADGVKNAFEDINEVDGIGSALAGRSGTLRAGDRLFVGGFRTVVWSGRIQSFDAVDYFSGLASQPPTTPVSYDSRFPAAAARNILTSTAKNTAVLFPTSDLSGLSAEQIAALNNDPLLLRWVRGDQSTEARNSANGFRNRRNGDLMGTVVNSQPIYSKAPDSGYKTRKPKAAAASPTTGPGSYTDFVKLNEQYRPARVYVNANGGMLHAFDASGGPLTNTNYMNEVFAYVPRAAYPRFPSLASPGYVHRYLVDGPVVEGDVYLNGKWRNVIVGTTGAGPKGVFALDVTQRNGTSPVPTIGTTEVLFDIAGTDDDPASTTDPLSFMGHILQPGVIGSGLDGEWYYFVGNGYESQNDKAALLAIRIRDGDVTVIKTDDAGGPLPNSATVSNRPNGLGGITPLYDQNRNVVAIYAGDRLGRMWKFDLSANSASAWAATPATKLFEAISPSPSGQPQAITAAPRVMQHPLGGRILIFGTGKVFEEADLTDVATVHSVYGIREGTATAPTVAATATKSDLLQLTLVDQVDGTTGDRFRQLTGVPDADSGGFPWTGAGAKRGWYFDLRASSARGERVVQAPVENFGFANITTYEPSEDGNPCLGGGKSFFYRLDIAGSFTRAPFQNTGSISNLVNSQNGPALNTLVGSELDAGTISRLEQLVIPAIATTSTSSSLTGSQTAGLADRTASVSTNPCAAARVGGQGVRGTALTGPALNCPVTPLRVWRELPRNPR